jgi:hypothetical protein
VRHSAIDAGTEDVIDRRFALWISVFAPDVLGCNSRMPRPDPRDW